MGKKKFGHAMQIVSLLLFIIMALACASQSSMVDSLNGEAGSRRGNSSGSTEGAAIETPADSITASYDLALN